MIFHVIYQNESNCQQKTKSSNKSFAMICLMLKFNWISIRVALQINFYLSSKKFTISV